MTMIAYAFLQYRRLKTAGREKKNQRAAASTDPASRASGILELIAPLPQRCPHCRKWICNTLRRE
jgi:hypothetical protein